MVTIALGTAQIGGLRRRIERDEAFKIFDAAWEEGIRHFDTAALYGAGRAEILLGEWIISRGIPRNEIFVTTKIARHLVTPDADHPFVSLGFVGGNQMNQILDYSYLGAMRQIEKGLARLQLDYVDALLLHDIDPQNHGEQYKTLLLQAMHGTYDVLQRCKEHGIALSIGLGVNNFEPFDDFFNKKLKLDCGVLAGRYTLLEQGALPTLHRAAQAGINIFLAGNLNSGLLAGRPIYNYRQATDDEHAQAARIQQVCDDQGVAMGAAALQFAAAGPAVTRIVIGPDSVDELRTNLEWARTPIRPSFWPALKREGIIDNQAPVPSDEGLKGEQRWLSKWFSNLG